MRTKEYSDRDTFARDVPMRHVPREGHVETDFRALSEVSYSLSSYLFLNLLNRTPLLNYDSIQQNLIERKKIFSVQCWDSGNDSA